MKGNHTLRQVMMSYGGLGPRNKAVLPLPHLLLPDILGSYERYSLLLSFMVDRIIIKSILCVCPPQLIPS